MVVIIQADRHSKIDITVQLDPDSDIKPDSRSFVVSEAQQIVLRLKPCRRDLDV